MDDHPDLQQLGQPRSVDWHQIHPARDGVLNALRAAILWLTAIAVLASIPSIAWLWTKVW